MSVPHWLKKAAANKELLFVNGGMARFRYRSRHVIWIRDLMVPPESLFGEAIPCAVELNIFRVLAEQRNVRFIEIILPAMMKGGAVPLLQKNEATVYDTTVEHSVMSHWWRMDVHKGVKSVLDI